MREDFSNEFGVRFMKTGKKILAFLLAVSMMVPMSACGSKVKTPEDIQNAGTLYMATNAEFEPFEYKDGDGSLASTLRFPKNCR